MDVVSVSDLACYSNGTTSAITKAKLVGRFSIVSTENTQQRYTRGSIVLLDQTTDDCILCHTDRFHHELDGVTVCIHNWNYVDETESGITILEFELVDVFRIASGVLSVAMEIERTDEMAMQSIVSRNVPIYRPIRLQECEATSSVNVVGCVLAKSALYIKPGEEALFFIQLVDANWSVSIMFQGDALIKHYHTFCIDTHYLFSNVRATVMTTPRLGESVAFLYEDGKSGHYTVTKRQYDILPSEETRTQDYSMGMPPAAQRHLDTSNTTVYTGTVTRVLDPLFGIYELDGELILCLFHYMGYSLQRPYRCQTQLRVYHPHMVAVEPNGDVSLLLDTLWKAPFVQRGDCVTRIVLVACTRSHVQVLKFPRHCEVEEEQRAFASMDCQTEIRKAIYANCVQRHVNFNILMQYLELSASLAVKFFSIFQSKTDTLIDTIQHIIRHVFFDKSYTGHARRDLLYDFFRHDNHCPVVPSNTRYYSNNTVQLDVYPSIQEFWAMALKKEENDESPVWYAAMTTVTETERVDVVRSRFEMNEDPHSQAYLALGVVEAAVDGRLYFKDDTMRIPLVILHGDAGCGHNTMPLLEDLYCISRYHIICEDLAYMNASREKISPDCLYLVCSAHDMTHIQSLAPQPPPFFMCLPENVKNMTHILGPSSVHDVSIFCALVIYPIEVCYDADGKVYLECRLRAAQYVIVSADSQENTVPSEVTLVFSSQSKSLQYVPQLSIGCWFGLSGLVDMTRLWLDPKEYKKASQALQDQPSILFVQSSNEFYRVVHRMEPGATPLTPVLIPVSQIPPIVCTTMWTLSKVLQVKDLIGSNKTEWDNYAERTISSIEIKNGLFEDLVDVEGIIINKGTRDSFRKNGDFGQDACRLFQDLGVGTGKTGRTLFVRLRQTDGLDTVDVYLDVHSRLYPLGLITGSFVRFRKLARKQASKTTGVYCIAHGCTAVETWPSLDDQDTLVFKHLIPFRYLNAILPYQPDPENTNVFKSTCSVRSILSLVLQWLCTDCGSVVNRGLCYGMCKNGRRLFMAEAIVLITDGTAEAHAMVDGERLVFKLLMLASNHRDTIKAAVVHSGTMTAGRWKTRFDDSSNIEDDEGEIGEELRGNCSIEDLCMRAVHDGHFDIYGRHIVSKYRELQGANDVIKKLGLRRIRITDEDGARETLATQAPRIKVVELERVDTCQRAWDLIDQLSPE